MTALVLALTFPVQQLPLLSSKAQTVQGTISLPVPATQIQETPGIFQIRRDDEPGSVYVTAPESRSSTEEDERKLSAPPSPSSSIRSITRRPGQASHPPPALKGTKRPSHDSDHGHSPKLTKLSKELEETESPLSPAKTTPADRKSSLFKKPSLESAPSFQRISPRTSMNTSFNGTTTFSSQRTETDTQPNTAFTSFNSDYVPPEPEKMTRTSSTTMGSLSDHDFLEIARNEGAPTRVSNSTTRSSTTWGSMDEDAMVRVSVEQAITVEPQPTVPSPDYLDSSGESPQKPSPFSPSGMSHHIRDIPRQNIFVDDVDEQLKRYPYFILFICLRLSIERRLSLQDVMTGLDENAVGSDPEAFWGRINDNIPSPPPSRSESKAWQTIADSFDGYTFKGIVSLN